MVITILWVDFDICNFLYCCILLQKAVKNRTRNWLQVTCKLSSVNIRRLSIITVANSECYLQIIGEYSEWKIIWLGNSTYKIFFWIDFAINSSQWWWLTGLWLASGSRRGSSRHSSPQSYAVPPGTLHSSSSQTRVWSTTTTTSVDISSPDKHAT